MIYFITCRAVNRVKIGHTRCEPRRRMSLLQVGSPVPLLLEAVAEGGLDVEAALHARFASACIRGEWFEITPEIDDVISENRIVAGPPRTIANPVARVLNAFQISQYDLADHLGVTQATISRMATGKMAVSRRTEVALRAVEQALQKAAA
jgi:DNA-binding XRE family transcriptional regulator